MQAFIYSGAHKKAIAAFRKIASGKTLGFESEVIPSWEEVRAMWEEQGRNY
jgi:hypothetical protein